MNREEKVITKLIKARIQMLLNLPFFGNLATRLVFRDATDSEWCKTAATDGRHFYYNKDFIEKLDCQELIFLFAHEVCHCFPPGTIIPGEFKNIEDYKVGDHIIGNGGIDSKVVIPMERNYNGDLIEIKARGMLPLQMTSEHPILVRDAKWKWITIGKRKYTSQRVWSEPRWVKAKDLKENMWIHMPCISGNIVNPIMNFEFEANKWSSPKKLYHGTFIDNDVAIFLGWYVAEGSTTTWKDSKGRIHWTSAISLHLNEKLIAEQLSSIIKDKFGIWTSIIDLPKRNSCQLRFGSKPLGKWLVENCGKGAHNKRIPKDILYNNDLEILKSFLKAYIAGDGNITENIKFATVSKILAYQVQLAFGRFGTLMNIRMRDPKRWKNYETAKIKSGIIYVGNCGTKIALNMFDLEDNRKRPTQYFGKTDDSILTLIKSIKREKYIGKVYNMETSCHTYTAGNIMSHNCVYQHMDRRGSRNRLIWNMAADFVINLELYDTKIGKIPNPKTCGVTACMDERFRGMYTEEVYKLLESDPAYQHLKYSEFDIHLEPNDGNGEPLTQKEIDDIKNEIKTALHVALKSNTGNIPGNIKRLIDDFSPTKMNWREILSQQICSILKNDYTWLKCSRKTQFNGIYLPAQKQQEMIDIAIGIDSSGSISDEMIKDFLGEVHGIMSQFDDFKIQLWCSDTKVYNPQTFTPDNVSDIFEYEIQGRGGNDFNCNWNYMKENNIVPKQFIHFTDGYDCGAGFGDPDYCDTIYVIHSNPEQNIVSTVGITCYYEP